MDSPSPSSPTTYTHGHHGSVLASHAARTAANSCAYFLDRLREGDSVLDIGCGPGSITLDLAEIVGPSGRVVGVDPAADAISAAQEAASRRGDTRTEFVRGDVHHLDLPPASFDVVHAHQVLQHLRDPVGALQAMARYCRPGGFVAARDADYSAMFWFPESPGMDRWRAVHTVAAWSNGAQPDAARRLRSWARAAGFENAIISSSTWTYATAEATSWWGNSQAARVRHSNFASQAVDQGLGPQEVEDIAVAWETWGEDPDAWFTIVHGEVLITRPAG